MADDWIVPDEGPGGADDWVVPDEGGPKNATLTGQPAPGIGSRRTSGFLGMFSIPNIVEGFYNAAKSAPDVTKRVMTGQLDPASEQGIREVTPLAGLAVVPSVGRAVTRPTPATVVPEDVAAAVRAGYQAAEQSGTVAPRADVRAGLSQIQRDIAGEFHPELTPRTSAMVGGEAARYAPPKADPMSAMTGVAPREAAPVPVVQELKRFREQLNDAIQDSATSNKDRGAALMARERVDQLMEQLAPAEAGILREANANYGAVMRQNAIENIQTRALDRAGANASGANIENAIRQEVRAFIRPDNRGVSPAMRSGFTDAEINAMRQFTREGVSGGNMMRMLGNLMGGGGGLGAAVVGLGAGMAGAGAAGALLPAGGAALKSIGNARTVRGLEQLSQDTLRRAPAAGPPPLRITVGLPRPRLPPATLGYPTLTEPR